MITGKYPETWQQLEQIVLKIFLECDFEARKGDIELARGKAEVDVFAVETIDQIENSVICECKYWSTNVTQTIVHALRTIVTDSGANAGYIISKVGFQEGAIQAAKYTNIKLVTLEEFQKLFFDKWIRHTVIKMHEFVNVVIFPLYGPEPDGRRGLEKIADAKQRELYLEVWHKYEFLKHFIVPLSIYMPWETYGISLPLNPKNYMDAPLPDDILDQTHYKELFDKVIEYGVKARRELEQVVTSYLP